MTNKLQILLFIILTPHIIVAQEDNSKGIFSIDGLEATFHDGIVMPHNETIDYLTEDYINSFSFHILYNTDNEKLWKKIYNKPKFGFGVNYSTLGNNEVFGKAYSVYPFFEAPLLTLNHAFRLNYRLSYGISYITKTFDLQENVENIAISSRLNIYFNFILNAEMKVLNDTYLFGSGGITHFSNGKVKAPNKGINTITTALGLRHYFNSLPHKKKEIFNPPEVKQKNRFSVIWSHGLKEHSRYIEGFFYISSLNLSYERKYAHWAQYGAGLDAFYDKSLRIRIEGDPRDKFDNSHLYRLGAHVSHDFLVGDVALTIQLGHYFYSKSFFITNFYNRIGLKYYFNDQWIANMSLKSHNANAEFIEFGLGYFWN